MSTKKKPSWPNDIPSLMMYGVSGKAYDHKSARYGETIFYVLNGEICNRASDGEQVYITNRRRPGYVSPEAFATPVKDLPPYVQEYIKNNTVLMRRFSEEQEAEIMSGVKAGIAYQEYADPQLFPEAMRDVRLKLSEWILTDDDCLQHGRLISLNAPVWEFTQINSTPDPNLFCIEHGQIDLRDYSDDEKQDMLLSYGYIEDTMQTSESLSMFYRKYGRSSDQLLAEMFFETECAGYEGDQVHGYNYAVGRIEKITGLDLTQYKIPVKNKKASLADQILDASNQKVSSIARNNISKERQDSERGGER